MGSKKSREQQRKGRQHPDIAGPDLAALARELSAGAVEPRPHDDAAPHQPLSPQRRPGRPNVVRNRSNISYLGCPSPQLGELAMGLAWRARSSGIRVGTLVGAAGVRYLSETEIFANIRYRLQGEGIAPRRPVKLSRTMMPIGRDDPVFQELEQRHRNPRSGRIRRTPLTGLVVLPAIPEEVVEEEQGWHMICAVLDDHEDQYRRQAAYLRDNFAPGGTSVYAPRTPGGLAYAGLVPIRGAPEQVEEFGAGLASFAAEHAPGAVVVWGAQLVRPLRPPASGSR